MRVASALLVVGTLWTGGAEASSIVVLPAMTAPLGPSMVAVGQTATPDVTVAAAIPEPAQPSVAEPGQIKILSPSVIALGEPAVADENVAAIGTETKRLGPNAIPMVIRGGVVGDPFAFSPMATSAPVKVQGEPQAAQAPLPASPAEAASAPKAPGPLAPATPASPAAPAMKPQ